METNRAKEKALELIKLFQQFGEAKFTTEGKIMDFAKVKVMALTCANQIQTEYGSEFEADEKFWNLVMQEIKIAEYEQ